MISLRLRVNRRTSPSRRWAWMRAPSSFHSTDAGPVAASAVATSGAGDASIGCTARPGTMPTVASAASPPVSAARAVAPREPDIMCARRTAAIGTPAALATASTITPSSAPWRSSPPSTRHSNCCSGSVARPNTSVSSARRAALTPLPDIEARRSIAASTSRTQRRLARPASTSTSRSVAHPTPMRPWRGRAGEDADGDVDLVGCEAPQQRGQQRRLLAALASRSRAPARSATRPV